MSDKLLYEMMLLILKSNMEVYNHGTLESSNTDVRRTIEMCLDTTLKLQEDLYNKMTLCGWYKICNIDSNDIKKTLKKVCQN